MVYFGYRLKRLLRSKMLIFWALIFPIGLGTLFKMAFSSITESDWSFRTIAVAVTCEEGEADENFISFLKEMKNGEKAFFDVKEMSLFDAKEQMKEEKISAIIQTGNEMKLIVSESSLSTTVVKTVLDGYLQGTELMISAAKEGKLQEALTEFSNEISVIAKKEYKGGSKDPMIQYFYALLAMASLYGAMFGLLNAQELDPQQSTIAARRVAAPVKRLPTVLSDVFSAFLIQFLQFLVLVVYFAFILKTDFGSLNGYLFLAGAVHSLVGVLYGYLIGAAIRKSEGIQNAVMMGTVMTSCFLAGLMIGNMRINLEQTAPIVNRINPATLMSASLHYLCVLKDMDRFYECIIGLLIWCAIFISLSVFFIWFYQQKDKRRNREGKEKQA